jgi:hypothetical protein
MSDQRRMIVRAVLLFWAAQMIVVTAVLAQQNSNHGDVALEAAITTANLGSLTLRVNAIEQARVIERIAILESVAKESGDTRRLLYGVIGGVVVQLLVSAMQLKRKN